MVFGWADLKGRERIRFIYVVSGVVICLLCEEEEEQEEAISDSHHSLRSSEGGLSHYCAERG